MRGVILAGGLGSRLQPLTNITNKHLLPVYDRPMIYYPIAKLVEAGIDDIILVTGGNYAGDFLRLLGNGKAFDLSHINYVYQKGEGGIAEALGLCEHYAAGDSVCVILGDNIFEDSIRDAVSEYTRANKGGRIFLKEVPDPERFGVAELKGDQVVGIEEKPKNPKSKYAVTGIYMYDAEVFNVIKTLKPSGRGELEITDVNNYYVKNNAMKYSFMKGWWTDAGTFESLFHANELVAKSHRK